MLKKVSIIVFSGVVIVAGIGVWKHYHKAKPATKMVTATLGRITTSATAIGNIIPKQVITVKSQVSGTAEQVLVKSGGYIKQGTPLVKVKPNPVPDQLAQKIGLVAQDKAQLDGAMKQLKNYDYLLKNKVILKNNTQYITFKQQAQAGLAKYHADKQSLELYQNGKAVIDGKLVQNMVKSPVSGFILQRNINPGDMINSVSDMQAATVLFTIADMKKLIFKGTVDERDADKLKVGMKATVTIGALPNKTLQGKIISVALQSDAQNSISDPSSSLVSNSNTSSQSPFSVGFEVEIGDLNIPKNITLRSGFSATADMVVDQAKNVVVLPQSVIVFKDNKTYVNVLDDQSKKTTLQPVTLGLTDGTRVEIVKGLKAGAHIEEVTTTGAP